MAFRKYPSFRKTPHRVAQLISQGTPSATQQTVIPTRRRTLGNTRNSVQTLQGYGPVVSGSNGTLSTTLGAITSTATGAVLVTGTLSTTLGAVTLVATSADTITGTLSVTLGPVTSAQTYAQITIAASYVRTLTLVGSETHTLTFRGSAK